MKMMQILTIHDLFLVALKKQDEVHLWQTAYATLEQAVACVEKMLAQDIQTNDEAIRLNFLPTKECDNNIFVWPFDMQADVRGRAHLSPDYMKIRIPHYPDHLRVPAGFRCVNLDKCQILWQGG